MTGALLILYTQRRGNFLVIPLALKDMLAFICITCNLLCFIVDFALLLFLYVLFASKTFCIPLKASQVAYLGRFCIAMLKINRRRESRSIVVVSTMAFTRRKRITMQPPQGVRANITRPRPSPTTTTFEGHHFLYYIVNIR